MRCSDAHLFQCRRIPLSEIEGPGALLLAVQLCLRDGAENRLNLPSQLLSRYHTDQPHEQGGDRDSRDIPMFAATRKLP